MEMCRVRRVYHSHISIAFTMVLYHNPPLLYLDPDSGPADDPMQGITTHISYVALSEKIFYADSRRVWKSFTKMLKPKWRHVRNIDS